MRETETRRGREKQTATGYYSERKRNKLLGALNKTYVVHEKGRERLRETTARRGREKQTVGCTT